MKRCFHCHARLDPGEWNFHVCARGKVYVKEHGITREATTMDVAEVRLAADLAQAIHRRRERHACN